MCPKASYACPPPAPHFLQTLTTSYTRSQTPSVSMTPSQSTTSSQSSTSTPRGTLTPSLSSTGSSATSPSLTASAAQSKSATLTPTETQSGSSTQEVSHSQVASTVGTISASVSSSQILIPPPNPSASQPGVTTPTQSITSSTHTRVQSASTSGLSSGMAPSTSSTSSPAPQIFGAASASAGPGRVSSGDGGDAPPPQVGAIAGSASASLLCLLALLAVVFFRRRKKNRKYSPSVDGADPTKQGADASSHVAALVDALPICAVESVALPQNAFDRPSSGNVTRALDPEDPDSARVNPPLKSVPVCLGGPRRRSSVVPITNEAVRPPISQTVVTSSAYQSMTFASTAASQPGGKYDRGEQAPASALIGRTPLAVAPTYDASTASTAVQQAPVVPAVNTSALFARRLPPPTLLCGPPDGTVRVLINLPGAPGHHAVPPDYANPPLPILGRTRRGSLPAVATNPELRPFQVEPRLRRQSSLAFVASLLADEQRGPHAKPVEPLETALPSSDATSSATYSLDSHVRTDAASTFPRHRL